MKRRYLPLIAIALASAAAFVPASISSGAPTGPLLKPPKGFFGIVPQTGLTPEDAEYMKAGGIETVRLPLQWAGVQPTRSSEYSWGGFDAAVEIAARAGLEVLPSLGSPPKWASRKETTMPIDSAAARRAWMAFLRAAVRRYGPGGQFWAEHRVTGPNGEPPLTRPLPIRSWQIWNESNFFYFAFPVSPARYAKLVTISSKAIKSVRPGAGVILSGLFGEPTAKGRRGIPATTFLERLYAIPGMKNRFDGVSLHPYAVDSRALEEMVERFHEVSVENDDRPALYITEMGWGSQNDFQQVAFEQGIRGQAKQLRRSYRFLIRNARRLNLKGAYWFSWKDIQESCSFCDSVGFFRDSLQYKPKPAWNAFVQITGGRPRP